MNLCLFSGRVVRTPILETVKEHSRTTLTLAVRRNYKNKMGDYDTDFIYIIAWRKKADYLTRYIKQGDLIETTCSMCVEQYEKNGQKLTYRYLQCKDITFVSHPQLKPTSQDFYEDAPEEPIPEEITFRLSDNVDELENEM